MSVYRPPTGAPARLSPLLVRATHESLLCTRVGIPAIELLESFARLKKWTASCYAEYWTMSTDTALRDLHYLQQLGVINCLQGRGHGCGGREPDIYFLTKLGARVLTRHLGLGADSYIQAPTVALDEGEVTKGGLRKHKVPAKPGQDAHDLACLRLAVRYGWLDLEGWETRAAIRYLTRNDTPALLVPDFCFRSEESLWCVEVEGTMKPEHIRTKHARYRAMSSYWRRKGSQYRVDLAIVFTSNEIRKQVVRMHLRAFAAGPFGYTLHWADMEDALSVPPGEPLGTVFTTADYRELAERRRAYARWLLR